MTLSSVGFYVDLEEIRMNSLSALHALAGVKHCHKFGPKTTDVWCKFTI